MHGAPHASAAQLARAMDHQRELVSHARPVMEFVFEQTRDTDSMVILADAQGMLLQTLGDASFLDRAERVALRPGANWHEQWRGTNAIGTAHGRRRAGGGARRRALTSNATASSPAPPRRSPTPPAGCWACSTSRATTAATTATRWRW